jgi:hypothetical protein
VAIRTDYVVTMFNLQRQGAPLMLLNEMRQIFSFLARTDICITVTRLPGVENGLADALGRIHVFGLVEPARRWSASKEHIEGPMERRRCVPVFLPVQTIARAMQKLRVEKVRVVMVLSEWCGKGWWNLPQFDVEGQIDLGKSCDVLIPRSTMAADFS